MSDINAIIFDLDGVLYQPRCASLDIQELWAWSGKRFSKRLIYTNDVSYSKRERCDDAAISGAPCCLDELITPVDVVFDFVLPKLGLARPIFLGEPVQVHERGLHILENFEDADCIIIGDITNSCQIEIDLTLKCYGAKIPCFLLNGNRSNDMHSSPDVGALAFEAFERFQVSAMLVGKPSWVGFQYAVKILRSSMETTIFITDHAVNDAAGSVLGGIPTVIIDANSYWSNAPECIEKEIRSFIRSPHKRNRSMWE